MAFVGGIIPSLLWLWFWTKEERNPAVRNILGVAQNRSNDGGYKSSESDQGKQPRQIELQQLIVGFLSLACLDRISNGDRFAHIRTP